MCFCVVHVFVCVCGVCLYVFVGGWVSVVYGGVQTCEACVFVSAICGTFGP